MKTEQIRLALLIGRECSISKAARELFISQPTASNMLKALEAELGYPLFTRQHGGIFPTEEGTAFLKYAAAIEHSLTSIAKIQKPAKHLMIRIHSAKYEFAELAFGKLCEKYLLDDSAVDLSFQVVGDAEDALQMMDNGKCDAAVVFCRKNLYESKVQAVKKLHLETEMIGDSHLELTCRKGHPLLEGDTIHFKLLENYPCFFSVQSSNSELYAPELLTRFGISISKRVSMDPSPVRYSLLVKNDGYLISLPISKETKMAYELTSLPIEDSDVTVFAIFRADSQKEEVIKEYIHFCQMLFC